MVGEKLTKADVEKIKKEIEERKLVLRPKILEDVKTARAQGDLSENFEYYAARKMHIPVVQTIHNFRFICPKGFS